MIFGLSLLSTVKAYDKRYKYFKGDNKQDILCGKYIDADHKDFSVLGRKRYKNAVGYYINIQKKFPDSFIPYTRLGYLYYHAAIDWCDNNTERIQKYKLARNNYKKVVLLTGRKGEQEFALDRIMDIDKRLKNLK